MARSEGWSERALAGRHLAELAGEPEADALLLELLDDANTAVPQQTASALLRRADTSSVRVFLKGNITGVNEDAGAQCDAELHAKGLPKRLKEVLAALQDDEDKAVSLEAARTLRLLYIE